MQKATYPTTRLVHHCTPTIPPQHLYMGKQGNLRSPGYIAFYPFSLSRWTPNPSVPLETQEQVETAWSRSMNTVNTVLHPTMVGYAAAHHVIAVRQHTPGILQHFSRGEGRKGGRQYRISDYSMLPPWALLHVRICEASTVAGYQIPRGKRADSLSTEAHPGGYAGLNRLVYISHNAKTAPQVNYGEHQHGTL